MKLYKYIGKPVKHNIGIDATLTLNKGNRVFITEKQKLLFRGEIGIEKVRNGYGEVFVVRKRDIIRIKT